MTQLQNQRHETAINEYLKNGGNKTDAYRKAYPKSLNWSENAVNVNAIKLFNNTKVLLRLQELQTEIGKENIYELDNILNEFGNIAFSNITDIFDYNQETNKITLVNGVKKLSDLPKHVTACIKSIKQIKDGIEIKLHSKENAIAQIAKMKGYFTPEKTEDPNTEKYVSIAQLLRPPKN